MHPKIFLSLFSLQVLEFPGCNKKLEHFRLDIVGERVAEITFVESSLLHVIPARDLQ